PDQNRDEDDVVDAEDDLQRRERDKRDPRLGIQQPFHVSRQNRPTTLPSSVTSIFSAEGTFGSPGMVIMSPQIITTNSAPAASRTSRTFTTCPSGAPRVAGLVVNDDCVFATHTG